MKVRRLDNAPLESMSRCVIQPASHIDPPDQAGSSDSAVEPAAGYQAYFNSAVCIVCEPSTVRILARSTSD
jgi:hypothetical protein